MKYNQKRVDLISVDITDSDELNNDNYTIFMALKI